MEQYKDYIFWVNCYFKQIKAKFGNAEWKKKSPHSDQNIFWWFGKMEYLHF